MTILRTYSDNGLQLNESSPQKFKTSSYTKSVMYELDNHGN